MNSTKTINHDEMIPLKFQLSQNYPNPFTEKTIIKYCIAYKTSVKISVYNPERNISEKLVDEEKTAGTYEIEFDATNLPSGVYFYQLQAFDPESSSGQVFIETKKMILLR